MIHEERIYKSKFSGNVLGLIIKLYHQTTNFLLIPLLPLFFHFLHTHTQLHFMCVALFLKAKALYFWGVRESDRGILFNKYIIN